MIDKQQLQAMGEHQAEQHMCMAKQIEDLQARLQECANGAAKMQEQRDEAYVMAGKSGLERDKFAQQLKAANQRVAVMAESLREAVSVLSSINHGREHRVIIDDEPAFWQRDEWVSWATGDVLPMLRAALSCELPDHVAGAGKMVPEGCAMLYVGNGMFAMCDWEDWPIVMGYWWHLSTERGSTRYAQAHDSHDTSKRKRIAMHRLILSAGDGDIVDHVNGDGLDNRRANLRIVTSQQNAFNQKHHGGSSRHKGVSYRADTRTWRAYITMGGRRRYLGNFASEDDAANAYNKEAAKLFGEHAKLNSVTHKLEPTK